MNGKNYRISRVKGTVKPPDDQPLFLHLLALMMIVNRKDYTGNSLGIQLRIYLSKLDLRTQRGMGEGGGWGLRIYVLVFLRGPAREEAGRFTMQYILLGWSDVYWPYSPALSICQAPY